MKGQKMVRIKHFFNMFLHAFSKIGYRPMLIFRLGASAVCLALAAIVYSAKEAATHDPLGAFSYYAPMVEYIVMTLLIVFVGMLAFDTAEKYYEQ